MEGAAAAAAAMAAAAIRVATAVFPVPCFHFCRERSLNAGDEGASRWEAGRGSDFTQVLSASGELAQPGGTCLASLVVAGAVP